MTNEAFEIGAVIAIDDGSDVRIDTRIDHFDAGRLSGRTYFGFLIIEDGSVNALRPVSFSDTQVIEQRGVLPLREVRWIGY